MIMKVFNYINYWYFRYLLVTELYMVEKWERVMIHIVFFILLSIISLFNTSVILGLVSWATQSLFIESGGLNDGSLSGANTVIHSEF